jgi:hypothetical protein
MSSRSPSEAAVVRECFHYRNEARKMLIYLAGFAIVSHGDGAPGVLCKETTLTLQHVFAIID